MCIRDRNRSIKKTNRLIREIRAQIGKLKEWIADLFKARETAPVSYTHLDVYKRQDVNSGGTLRNVPPLLSHRSLYAVSFDGYRLSVGDEDRDGGESNSIQNQKIFLENYARGQHLTNIRHYIDDDESGRFFDRSAYSRMMDDVENGKIGVCIMKDLTRWGRDYLQVGNAMEIFRRNNVRFIAVNNGIDSEKPDTCLLYTSRCV